MKQSLPALKSIAYLPCSLLPPDTLEKYLTGIPVGIFAAVTPVVYFDSSSCEAEAEYHNGVSYEKTTLKFRTTDEIPRSQDIAFVITDVQGKSYLIGHRELPYPMVAITSVIDKDTNIFEVKVAFSARKSLIPCAF